MSKLKRALMQASASASGGAAEATYVDDVFSTYLYEGDGSNRVIQNDIKLGNTTTGGSVYFPQGSYGVFNFGSDNVYPVQLSSNITLSSDFTIEMWINRDGTQRYGECILSPDYGVTSSNIQIGINNSDTLPESQRNVMYIYDGSGKYGSTSVTVPPKGWFHIAYSRSGSTLYFWVNGVAAGSVTTSHSFVINTIGALGGYGAGPVGYISNLRISDNARYTTAFTPPTSALSTDVNTLLLTFQGDFVDQTGNRTLTVNGNTAASTEGPFDSGSGGYGGLVWVKNRSGTGYGTIFDTERGIGNYLISGLTNGQASSSAGERLTAFTSDGFLLGTDPGQAVNNSLYKYASWTFRKQPGFFDVVTWSGDGTAGRQISHNLESTPGFVVIKRTDSADNWKCWHTSTGDGVTLELDNTGTDTGENWPTGGFTSTYFTVNSGGSFNAIGGTYVAYLFAHDAQDFGTNSDESIIYCGTYEGNGTTKTVTLGWEPQWCLIKNIDDAANDWQMFDTMRGAPVGDDTQFLNANDSGAEQVGSGAGNIKWYPRPNGFEVLVGGGGANDPNENNETYIFIAIRKSNKPASEFAATELFDLFKYTDNLLYDQSTNPIELTYDRQTRAGDTVDPGPAVLTDMWWHALRSTGKSNSYFINSRLQGAGNGMVTNRANASPQGDATEMKGYDRMTGVEVGPTGTFYYNSTAAGSREHISYYFRRAPGFFDIATYDGNLSTSHSVNHNLGVVPELIIIKSRDANYNWRVYFDIDSTDYEAAYLNASLASSTVAYTSGADMTAQPTSSTFTLGSDATVNDNGFDFVAYLFASAPGISKVGTVSHTTGSTTDVDCGFSNGARFVLVKRISDTGHWVMMDSDRGINAGNDPFLLLSSTAAEDSTQDVIDPLSTGFQMQGYFATGTWLFLAIA